MPKLTVAQKAPVEGLSKEKERGLFDRQVADGLNITGKQAARLTTNATAALTEIWRWQLPQNAAWFLEATVVYRSRKGGAQVGNKRRRRLYYRDTGDAVLVGVAGVEYEAGAAGFTLDFALDGATVLIKVKDDGTVTDWYLVVETTEVAQSA